MTRPVGVTLIQAGGTPPASSAANSPAMTPVAKDWEEGVGRCDMEGTLGPPRNAKGVTAVTPIVPRLRPVSAAPRPCARPYPIRIVFEGVLKAVGGRFRIGGAIGASLLGRRCRALPSQSIVELAVNVGAQCPVVREVPVCQLELRKRLLKVVD